MRIDDIREQFENFTERAEAVLRFEVEKARKAVAALNADKDTASTELVALKDQLASEQKQLDAVLSNLHRASGLAGLDHDITEARKTLEALKADIAGAETARAKAVKECSEAERELSEARDEMARLAQQGSQATAELSRVRALFDSVDLRRSA
jgi:chromosome segregation ATPase